MDKTRNVWPLFWCISVTAQAALMQYQWDHYGFRLQIPSMPSHGRVDTEVEKPEEIAKIIRHAPRHQRRVR